MPHDCKQYDFPSGPLKALSILNMPALWPSTNTDALNNLSLRGVERRSNLMKNEIAAPLGLAMTYKDIYYARINLEMTHKIIPHSLQKSH